jgi:hypothetical protein
MCHGAQIIKILIMQIPQLLPISSLCRNNTKPHYILPVENLGKIFYFNILNYYILHTEHTEVFLATDTQKTLVQQGPTRKQSYDGQRQAWIDVALNRASTII